MYDYNQPIQTGSQSEPILDSHPWRPSSVSSFIRLQCHFELQCYPPPLPLLRSLDRTFSETSLMTLPTWVTLPGAKLLTASLSGSLEHARFSSMARWRSADNVYIYTHRQSLRSAMCGVGCVLCMSMWLDFISPCRWWIQTEWGRCLCCPASCWWRF